MQPWIKSPSFTVTEPTPWPAAKPVSPWAIKEPEPAQPYQSDENLKKLFGIELAKCEKAFEAGCNVFGEDTSKALWAAANWLNDPLVISSRDIYLKNLELSAAPLDRNQLAAKVLKLAEGEFVDVGNGIKRPTIDAKDRLTAFKLYSDILGYTGKVEIDNSTNNNITNNEITIKLVKAENKPALVIDNVPNTKSEIANETSPISLKMVKAG
jgi:hypothetical protein